MAWIKVTSSICGRERLINTADIDWVHDDEEKTEIEFEDKSSMSVKENVDKIAHMIFLAEGGFRVD